MTEISVRTDYEVFSCECGATYALPSAFVKKLRDSHKTFYCPNGCSRYFPQESDKEILQRKNEELKKNLFEANDRVTYWFDRSESEKRSKAAYKAHHTILKKKIKKGQCPCCNQNFPDVAEHIKSSHPDYNKRMKVKKK